MKQNVAGLEIDSKKVEINKYSIKKVREKSLRRVENNAVNYRLQPIVPALGLEIDS